MIDSVKFEFNDIIISLYTKNDLSGDSEGIIFILYLCVINSSR